MKEGSKPSNPKEAFGVRKLIFSVIPFSVLWEVGIGMLEGALKYGRHNYEVMGIRASTYMDATIARHLMRWWSGEDIDKDSNLNHVTKAICSLVVLRAGMIKGNWTDDRPPKVDMAWVDQLEKLVGDVLDRVPPERRVDPYTAIGEAEKEPAKPATHQALAQAFINMAEQCECAQKECNDWCGPAYCKRPDGCTRVAARNSMERLKAGEFDRPLCEGDFPADTLFHG